MDPLWAPPRTPILAWSRQGSEARGGLGALHLLPVHLSTHPSPVKTTRFSEAELLKCFLKIYYLYYHKSNTCSLRKM